MAQVCAYFPGYAVSVWRVLIVHFLWNRWMSSETGTHSDVPHHMIYPLKDTCLNLHFVMGIHAKHVTFDECA